MDEAHSRAAAIGLQALAPFGFALAGGYAVQAHGLVRRRSDDVDLFTDDLDPAEFSRAVAAAESAFADAGFVVEVEARAEVFARLMLTDPDGS